MTPNFDTGRVRVQLTCTDGKVSAIQVGSERPDVAVVLRGRTADHAVQLLPLLFALCGQAQARAAALALAAARGEECVPQLDPNVQREVIREHLWRCLLDLPPLLGEDAFQQEFVSAVKWIAEGNRAELHALLNSSRIASLHQRLQQIEESHPIPSRLLPRLNAKKSLAEWPRLSARFCRLPDWRGMPAGTGAIARQQQMHNPEGHSCYPVHALRSSSGQASIHLVAQGTQHERGCHQVGEGPFALSSLRSGRIEGFTSSNCVFWDNKTISLFSSCWRARFDELFEWATGGAQIGEGGTVSAIPVAPGIGRSLVETARGLLMHEIVLDGERIADYFIVAPTEWNFHPQGILVDELLEQDAGDRDALQQHVARAVAALDPCVPWELEWA